MCVMLHVATCPCSNPFSSSFSFPFPYLVALNSCTELAIDLQKLRTTMLAIIFCNTIMCRASTLGIPTFSVHYHLFTTAKRMVHHRKWYLMYADELNRICFIMSELAPISFLLDQMIASVWTAIKPVCGIADHLFFFLSRRHATV